MINTGVLSKSIAGSSELTLMADIRPGFVNLPDPLSYATRLSKLLGTLFSVRKVETEAGSAAVGPVDRLRMIHFFRFAVFDEGRRLLLAVSFDRPWEPYIGRLVDDAGPLLDAIFFHCKGYEGHSTRDGYPKFAEWVRGRQKACDFFFAALPGKSVDDFLYLKELQRNAELLNGAGAGGKTVASLALDSELAKRPVRDLGAAEYMNLYRTTVGLYRLRNYFPDNPVLDPSYSDRAVFDRAARMVIGSFGELPPNGGGAGSAGGKPKFPPLPPALEDTYLGILRWYEQLKRAPEPPKGTLVRPAYDDVQGGILEPLLDSIDPESYPNERRAMSHGAAVLLQFPTQGTSDNAEASVRNVFGVLIKKCQNRSGVRYNVGITAEGLKRIGLSDQELAAFPVEFLQGMAERAPLLGDVGSNYPDNWNLPELNVSIASGLDVQLSMVDAVVIVQARLPDAPGDHEWSSRHPLFTDVKLLETNGCTLLHVQALRRYESRRDRDTDMYREHFGFLDGFGQPEIADVAASGPAGRNQVSRGEVLLGHPNDSGEAPGLGDPLLSNGSFLVLRKISQNVPAFNQLTESASSPRATKLLGRSAAGVPATDPRKQPTDAFDYDRDADGTGCPLQSHVRLANPRTPEGTSAFGRRKRVPRIVRRGFSYGLPVDHPEANETTERGVLFMAYNASIAAQYEVIQRWLNGGNSTGLDSSQRCPLTGAVDGEGGTLFRYRDAGSVTTLHLDAKRRPSKVEWGMYLFVPSFSALSLLRDRLIEQISTQRARAAGILRLSLDEQNVVSTGQRILSQLLKESDSSVWRGFLEEQGMRQQSFALLTAIRLNHRVLRTPMGILVAGARETEEVLKREDLFSVREYWSRMQQSEMPMHLGMDIRPVRKAVCPAHAGTGEALDAGYVAAVLDNTIDYRRESIANPLIHKLSRAEAFCQASSYAADFLRKSVVGALAVEAHVREQLPPGGAMPAIDGPRGRVSVDLFILTEQVVSRLSKLWFGLPDGQFMLLGGQPRQPEGSPPESLAADDPKSYCPSDFTVFSQYVFRPEPDDWTASLSAKRGKRVTEAARSALSAMRDKNGKYEHGFLKGLQERGEELGLTGDPLQELVVRSAVGAVDGFVAAAFGSVLSVIGQWLQTEDFWRLQRSAKIGQLAALGKASSVLPGTIEAELADSSPFVREAIGALKFLPKPPWLHRVALKDTLLGNVLIKKGDRVSVHLGQAALEQAGPELLFGGRYDERAKLLVNGERTPSHACPGKEVSMGVLLGLLVSVLNLRNVEVDGTLAISFEPDAADEAEARASYASYASTAMASRS